MFFSAMVLNVARELGRQTDFQKSYCNSEILLVN